MEFRPAAQGVQVSKKQPYHLGLRGLFKLKKLQHDMEAAVRLPLCRDFM